MSTKCVSLSLPEAHFVNTTWFIFYAMMTGKRFFYDNDRN